MGAPQRVGHILPNTRIAKLFGHLNIIFASEILVCGLCMSVSVITMPLLGRAVTQTVERADKQIKARQQSELDALAESEKAAKTDEEKADIAARRKEIESRPPSPLTTGFDLAQFGMLDPRWTGFSWAEVFSGIGLNVLLLASGIGLLECRGWARKLAVWTAVAKIVRLGILYSYFTVGVVPEMARRLGESVGKMMTMQPGMTPGGVPATDFFTRTYAITYSIMGVGMILIGSIYPVAVIWFLTRPAVKAACRDTAKPKPQREPLET
jgi:hypothetical protein